MLHDAKASREIVETRDFDVCVVGSGPAGITLARSLAAAGLDVALMEGGDLEFSAESQDLYLGDNEGLPYFPLESARLRYFGGTSGHWGGLCRPLDARDFEARPWVPMSGWPISRADIDPFEAEAAEILDLRPNPPNFDDQPAEAGLAYRKIGYRRSGPTRFGDKYRDELAASERIYLVVNANLVDIRLDPGLRRVTGAVFRSHAPGAPAFEVRARLYAICAGGIENARILLNANSQLPRGIGNGHDLVGRYFCEHPYVAAGDVLFAEPFFGAPRFGPTDEYLREAAILNHSVRLSGKEANRLTLWKELLRAPVCAVPFQERLGEAVLGRSVDCDGKGVAAYFDQRRDPTALTGVLELQLEQALDPASRVRLTDERDALGMRRVALEWRLNSLDFRTARAAVYAFAVQLASLDVGRVRVRDWLLAEDWQAALEVHDMAGSYHHLCTTRMADDPRAGVVNRDCRVHGIDNLYLGGSSVFATPGQTVPTFSIVQLALRLGAHMAAQARAGAPAVETTRG